MTTLLEYISLLFIIVGNFFMISAIIGLIRNNDFYVKLHTISMFNIYGANFILFAIGILSFKPIIFFEMIFVIIINTLVTLTVIHCLFRNAILNGVEYIAKTRDDITEEQTRQVQENREIFEENMRKDRLKEEEKERKLREKEEKKRKAREEKERLKREKQERKLKEKEEKQKAKLANKKQTIKPITQNTTTTQTTQTTIKPIEQQTKTTTSTTADKTTTTKTQENSNTNTINNMMNTMMTGPVSNEVASAMKMMQQSPMGSQMQDMMKSATGGTGGDTRSIEDIEKENEELRKKIKEQKKILRKKIETVRRNAFITRKPEEIEKAEKTIKDILTKYNLTEEMLKDDEE